MTESGNTDTYTTTLTGDLAGKASQLNLTIEGLLFADEADVTVTPGVVDVANSLVAVFSPMIQFGGVAKVNVQPRDAAGNTNPTGIAGVAISLSGGVGKLGPVTRNSSGTYTAVYTGTADGSNTILATMSRSKW